MVAGMGRGVRCGITAQKYGGREDGGGGEGRGSREGEGWEGQTCCVGAMVAGAVRGQARG